MFFLCSVFWCGRVSSWCVSDLLRLASLATTRYSFSLLYILAQKLVRCSCSYVLSEMVSSIYSMWLFCSWVHCFCFVLFFFCWVVDIAFMQQWKLFNANDQKDVCSFFFIYINPSCPISPLVQVASGFKNTVRHTCTFCRNMKIKSEHNLDTPVQKTTFQQFTSVINYLSCNMKVCLLGKCDHMQRCKSANPKTKWLPLDLLGI